MENDVPSQKLDQKSNDWDVGAEIKTPILCFMFYEKDILSEYGYLFLNYSCFL